jgi:hypothetical protein
MKKVTTKKSLFKTVFIIAIVAVMLVTFTACEDMGFPSSNSDETEESEPEETSPTFINTRDAAIMAVYQRLLSQAESYEAKLYLSDFYANCDNWTAQSEYFKDGSGTWYVVVDMTENEDWELRPYWQQASWFVFKDGEVIPSNLFKANALRIEADLQALSPEPAAERD